MPRCRELRGVAASGGETMIQNQQGASPESLVREVIARWREGQRPDAQEFLREHPEVRERKSLAIDLIYEEYCLRREHGETFVASTFMSRFPAYKQSLVRMLDVHEFLAGSAPAAAPVWPRPGEEFLGSGAQHLSSCLIADIRMPGMSGLDLQARLNQQQIRIPVILITAHGDERMRMQAMSAGAADFLAKPFDDEVLLRSIRAALEDGGEA